MNPIRSIAGAAAVPVAFGLAVAVLSASGGGLLGAPPPGDLSGWLERSGPVVAAMALVRLAALAAAGWMLLATSVRALAAAVGAARLVAAAERALPPGLRRACTGLAGVGAAGVVLLGGAGMPATGSAPERPAMERMVRLPASARQHVVAEPDPPTASMSVAPDPSPAPSPGDEWEVAPGESFWSMAEEVVGDRLGRPPTGIEIAGYWQRLVDANRARLVTANPDLIYPGQRFTLPG